MTRHRLCRALVVIGGLAVVWAIAVLWTGGFLVHLGSLRLSSRSARNPALLTLLSLAAAWVTAPAGRRTETLGLECQRIADLVPRWLAFVPTISNPAVPLAAATAIVIVIVGFARGAFVVGGSDSYGYVSQAHLWATGTLRQEPPLVRELSSGLALDVFTPLGYRPSVDGTTIAPTYSPGLPIVMAVFETLLGPRSVFWVIPLLGGLLVWTTFLIGRRIGGPGAGAVAAILVATTPAVLFLLTAAPLSDLPAAAWWMLTLACISSRGRLMALGAGAAAALAILTRPNLLPLIAIPCALLVQRFVADRRARVRTTQEASLFGFGVMPAVVTIAAVNDLLWGSPLSSGYGPLSALYDVSRVFRNLILYTRVILVQMPAIALLAIAAIAIARGQRLHAARDRTMLKALVWFVVVAVGCYLPFPAYDSADNLRFLVPALPPMLVLTSIVAFSWFAPLIQKHTFWFVLALVFVTGYGVDYARRMQAFDTRYLQKFAVMGDYVARLPERAVVFSMLHSGSAVYYSGRPIVRYDLLPPSRLDPLIAELRQHSYVPYILLDEDERMVFETRFEGHSTLAALDWDPVVSLPSNSAQLFAVPGSSQ
jgi:hypothetical protein